MILFKVVKSAYADDWKDVTKTSTYKAGARWNSPGIPVMYFSTNVQNAMLEIANYMPSPKMVNRVFVVSVFECPALRLHAIEPNELPADWASDTNLLNTQKLGSHYLLDSKNYDGILVPSVSINTEIATHPVNEIRTSTYSNIAINSVTVGVENIKLVEHYQPVYSHRMFG